MLHGISALFLRLSSFDLSHKIIGFTDDGIRSIADLKEYQPVGWTETELDALRRLVRANACTPADDSTVETLPAAPPTSRRPDFPTLREDINRTAAKRKLETSAGAREVAIAALIRDQYANSTRRPRDICWATWCAKAEMMGVSPLPLQIDNVSAIMSAFKAEGYKSVRNYTSRARQEHLAVLKMQPADDVLAHITKCERSVLRGLAKPKYKSSFHLEALEETNVTELENLEAQFPWPPIWLVVVGCWWILRGIELAAIRLIDIEFNDNNVAISLPVSKMDPYGKGARRCHGCCCQPGSSKPCIICPFHTVSSAVSHSKGLATKLFGRVPPDWPLFPDSKGNFISKETTAAAVRQVANVLGESSCDDTEDIAEHAMRVSGAQLLARSGVELYVIQLYGRWGSSVIERYVQEAPLSRSATLAARVLAGLRNTPLAPMSIAIGDVQQPPLYASFERTGRDTMLNLEDPDAMGSSTALADTAAVLEGPTPSCTVPAPPPVTTRDSDFNPPTPSGVAKQFSRTVIVSKLRLQHLEKFDLEGVNSTLWSTKCGWRFGSSEFTRLKLSKNLAICDRCFRDANLFDSSDSD